MKVAYQWLKSFVDVDIEPVQLAEKLTMAGLTVEHVTQGTDSLPHVVIGQITRLDAHPQADKLVVCQVDVGHETVQIVTGAANVKAGDKIPVALVGARLPNGLELGKASLRGVDSCGMLCSASELGVDENYVSPESRGGIWLLHPDVPVGAPAAEVLGLSDAVLEFELTPNRSDCLSVVNIAREVAAISGQAARLPAVQLAESAEKIEQETSVEVRDPDLCNRYTVRLVKGLTVAPSPEWLQGRLRAAGIRPINNVVDVSNYVMLETGQPLHFFDYDTLAGQRIIVRRALEGEQMHTLDGQLRTFPGDTLLICDGEKPVGVAGVMGGLNSEVTDSTTNILIEAARFHPVSIRRTSRLLGLRSEASLRFEKGLDVHNVGHACDRAAQLLAELGSGRVVSGMIDTYQGGEEQRVLLLRTARVNEILGTRLTAGQVAEVIGRLNFPLQVEAETLSVTIPAYRQDITLEVDLVEEVARLIGYDQIPVTLPSGETTEGRKTRAQSLEDLIRTTLAGAGLSEVLNYSFINPRELDRILLPQDHPLRPAVRVANPLSDEQGIMRTSLIPGLLNTASLNTSRRQTSLAIFECGRVFNPTDAKLPDEKLMVGALLAGEITKGWAWPGQKLDFFALKGVLAHLMTRLRLEEWSLRGEDFPPFLHPGRSGSLWLAGKNIGFLGEVHPSVLEAYDLESKACVMQLDVAALIAAAPESLTYRPVPKFPAVLRDLALVVPLTLPAEMVAAEIMASDKAILKDANLFDVYTGSQVAAGSKSLAFALTFQAADRTLKDEEVNRIVESVKARLAEKFGVGLR